MLSVNNVLNYNSGGLVRMNNYDSESKSDEDSGDNSEDDLGNKSNTKDGLNEGTNPKGDLEGSDRKTGRLARLFAKQARRSIDQRSCTTKASEAKGNKLINFSKKSGFGSYSRNVSTGNFIVDADNNHTKGSANSFLVYLRA
jgi:hypothetical protein